MAGLVAAGECEIGSLCKGTKLAAGQMRRHCCADCIHVAGLDTLIQTLAVAHLRRRIQTVQVLL